MAVRSIQYLAKFLGGIQLPSGAGTGLVLTSDAVGNANWQTAGATPQNMAAGESFTIPANKQLACPAGIVSAEPTGVIATILGIGVS